MRAVRSCLAGCLGLLLLLSPAAAQESPIKPFQAFEVLSSAQLNALVERLNSHTTALTAMQAALTSAIAEREALRATLTMVERQQRQTQEALTTLRADYAASQRALQAVQARIARKVEQGTVEALRQEVATLQGHPILALEPYMKLEFDLLNGLNGPHIRFQGVNVHIESGFLATDDGGLQSGLGNLIIGYNEEPAGLQAGDRAGAHNLVIGKAHRYSSYGGLVAGEENTLNGIAATVSSGSLNNASGNYASVSGGLGNLATGNYSSVSGGLSNFASGENASVSGGSGRNAPESDNWAAGSLLELQ
ncbi:MAG: hypothetical protein FJZ47_09885 [Candidatus Tectomicrobia bacterium]|uniref:Uncharacterized protein n=1 Tax=Tectimicrobiota bacterium TaxID=2528274 RepID=A0A938B2K0_UNCTE|nr:hypothetical protein [Candidatus Tectomicrobia bacterium]